MKKCIYTVNLGGYDDIPEPAMNNPKWDKVLFTDQDLPTHLIRRWSRVVKVEETDRPDLKCREIKWLSHKHLPEYDLVCYHDANFLIHRTLEPKPFRILHNKRSTVQQEADALNKQEHRWTIEEVDKQMDFMRGEGFPDTQGMWYGAFFCRTHSDEDNKLCEDVYDMLVNWTTRDQLALPYAMWKNDYKVDNPVEYTQFRQYTKSRPHKLKHKILGLDESIKVHHITPARSDKNYGKAINDIVKRLPDNDWICLRDIDTLPLDHVAFIKQCEKIASSSDYGLVSCMTNRLGLEHQLVYGSMLDGADMDREINKAKDMSVEHGIIVEEEKGEIAGLMMLFPKKAWEDVGGFKEGGIIFEHRFLDNIFLEDVRSKGYKTGIAKGIYLFHIYRWNKDRRDKTHLK